MLDGAARVDELVKEVANQGMPAIAICKKCAKLEGGFSAFEEDSTDVSSL